MEYFCTNTQIFTNTLKLVNNKISIQICPIIYIMLSSDFDKQEVTQ
jgi:hypothetical protein